jgi:siroheme synthase (precorrin-2 oxidase/ferrochelatase)
MSEKESKAQQFPEVQGGGSLILAWQVRNKHVLVVGGGEVSPQAALKQLGPFLGPMFLSAKEIPKVSFLSRAGAEA